MAKPPPRTWQVSEGELYFLQASSHSHTLPDISRTFLKGLEGGLHATACVTAMVDDAP